MKYYGNELYHHGILGQKWGIRRFQNKDGSYTTEGKKRRREDNWSDDYKRKMEIKKKSIKTLSNKELNDYTNRVNAEQNFRRAKINDSAIKTGMLYVTAAAGVIGGLAGVYATAKNGKKVYSEIMNSIKDIPWRYVGK